jgi:hypothetical protein
MNQYLYFISNNNAAYLHATIANGILWADQSCRISGTLSLAIRNASDEQIDWLIETMIADGCSVLADCPRWLNANYLRLAGNRFI